MRSPLLAFSIIFGVPSLPFGFVVCLLPLGFGLRMGKGHGAEAAFFESLLGVLAVFLFLL